jgi:hypothetical protein
MKKILSLALVLVYLSLFLAGCTSTSNINYSYKGFVTEVYENARGETVIAAVSDDVESEFVIKQNTKIIAPANIPVAVGDYIQLNTIRAGEQDVKEMKVSPGYSSCGRLVYVNGEETPFLLVENADSTRLFVKLVDDKSTLPGVSGTGDVIKVYHSIPVMVDDPTAVVEALIFIENGTAADITEEDVAFIASQGYIVISE